MTKTRYTVTHPNGTVSTRTSARAYTHAVRVENAGSYGVIRWSTRRDLAVAAMRGELSRLNIDGTMTVVPVDGVEDDTPAETAVGGRVSGRSAATAKRAPAAPSNWTPIVTSRSVGTIRTERTAQTEYVDTAVDLATMAADADAGYRTELETDAAALLAALAAARGMTADAVRDALAGKVAAKVRKVEREQEAFRARLGI